MEERGPLNWTVVVFRDSIWLFGSDCRLIAIHASDLHEMVEPAATLSVNPSSKLVQDIFFQADMSLGLVCFCRTSCRVLWVHLGTVFLVDPEYGATTDDSWPSKKWNFDFIFKGSCFKSRAIYSADHDAKVCVGRTNFRTQHFFESQSIFNSLELPVDNVWMSENSFSKNHKPLRAVVARSL